MLRILAILAILTVNASHATELLKPPQAAKQQSDSYLNFNTVTNKVADNFKHNFSMQRYIYQNLSYYVILRPIETDLVLPKTNNSIQGYNAQYQTLSTEYILAMDKKYIENLKKTVENHCKYNTYKDPAVCSPERIKSLFE